MHRVYRGSPMASGAIENGGNVDWMVRLGTTLLHTPNPTEQFRPLGAPKVTKDFVGGVV